MPADRNNSRRYTKGVQYAFGKSNHTDTKPYIQPNPDSCGTLAYSVSRLSLDDVSVALGCVAGSGGHLGHGTWDPMPSMVPVLLPPSSPLQSTSLPLPVILTPFSAPYPNRAQQNRHRASRKYAATEPRPTSATPPKDLHGSSWHHDINPSLRDHDTDAVVPTTPGPSSTAISPAPGPMPSPDQYPIPHKQIYRLNLQPLPHFLGMGSTIRRSINPTGRLFPATRVDTDHTGLAHKMSRVRLKDAGIRKGYKENPRTGLDCVTGPRTPAGRRSQSNGHVAPLSPAQRTEERDRLQGHTFHQQILRNKSSSHASESPRRRSQPKKNDPFNFTAHSIPAHSGVPSLGNTLASSAAAFFTSQWDHKSVSPNPPDDDMDIGDEWLPTWTFSCEGLDFSLSDDEEL